MNFIFQKKNKKSFSADDHSRAIPVNISDQEYSEPESEADQMPSITLESNWNETVK